MNRLHTMLAVALLGALVITESTAQNNTKATTVPQAVMQQVYQEVKTPYKYGLVLVPDNNNKKMDCPSVFRQGNLWYMTYVIFDGTGYETWQSTSKDLLHWSAGTRILSFSDSTQWDGVHKAGYPSLQEYEWNGSYALQTYQQKYWMSYFAGNVKGYEAGPLALGIAYTPQKNLLRGKEWQRLPSPILTATDSTVRWWENRKLFKSTVIWDKAKTTGHPFVMYYNANGDSAANNIKTRWYERIGMAVSDDMEHWQRFETEPVVHHSQGITGDPVIRKINDVWVMFYFGAFWKGRKDAFNRFACSYNLVNWTDWEGDDLVHSSEDYDRKFAHKSFVVKYNGVVYHFYCAVNNKDQRGIAVATSADLGKSTLQFVQ
ncbi:glycoside hydrolase family protein [Filimonas lacunae]|nr:glycosylase [Filimonas lacunae]